MVDGSKLQSADFSQPTGSRLAPFLLQIFLLMFSLPLLFWSVVPFFLVPLFLIGSLAAAMHWNRPYLALTVLSVGWAVFAIRLGSLFGEEASISIGVISFTTSLILNKSSFIDGFTEISKSSYPRRPIRDFSLDYPAAEIIGVAIFLLFASDAVRYEERAPGHIPDQFSETWLMLDKLDRRKFESLTYDEKMLVEKLSAGDKAERIGELWSLKNPICRYGRDRSNGGCYTKQERETMQWAQDQLMGR